MGTYILIIFMSKTSPAYQSGTTSISQEFSSQQTCLVAGNALAETAVKRTSYILTWGCFKK